MTFRAYWDTLEIVFRFDMQWEEFLRILMASVICGHFSKLVDHCVT